MKGMLKSLLPSRDDFYAGSYSDTSAEAKKKAEIQRKKKKKIKDDDGASVEASTTATSVTGAPSAGAQARREELQSRLADAERALEHKLQSGVSELSLDTSYFAPPEEEYRPEQCTLSDADLNTIHEKGESQMASFSPNHSTRPHQPPPFSNPLYSSSPNSSAALGMKALGNESAGYQQPQYVQEFLSAGVAAPMLLPPPAHAQKHSLSLHRNDHAPQDPRIPLSSAGGGDRLDVTSVDYSRSSVRSSLGSPPSGSPGAHGQHLVPTTVLQPSEMKKRPPAVRTSVAKPPISQSAGRSSVATSEAADQAPSDAHAPLGYALRQNETAPTIQQRGRSSSVTSGPDLPRMPRTVSREPSRRGMSVEPYRTDRSTVEASGRGGSVEPSGRSLSVDPRSIAPHTNPAQMRAQMNFNSRSHDHTTQDHAQAHSRRVQQGSEIRGRPDERVAKPPAVPADMYRIPADTAAEQRTNTRPDPRQEQRSPPLDESEARHVDDYYQNQRHPKQPDYHPPPHYYGYYDYRGTPPPGYGPPASYGYGPPPPHYMYPPHMYPPRKEEGTPTDSHGPESPGSRGPPSRHSNSPSSYQPYQSPPYDPYAPYPHHGQYLPPPGAPYPPHYAHYGAPPPASQGQYAYGPYPGYGPPPPGYGPDPRYSHGTSEDPKDRRSMEAEGRDGSSQPDRGSSKSDERHRSSPYHYGPTAPSYGHLGPPPGHGYPDQHEHARPYHSQTAGTYGGYDDFPPKRRGQRHETDYPPSPRSSQKSNGDGGVILTKPPGALPWKPTGRAP